MAGTARTAERASRPQAAAPATKLPYPFRGFLSLDACPRVSVARAMMSVAMLLYNQQRCALRDWCTAGLPLGFSLARFRRHAADLGLSSSIEARHRIRIF